MPTYQEILEEEQERADHVVDVLLICHRTVAIEREAINKGYFQEDTPKRVTIHAILVEAHHVLQ